jgi:N6-adenosine-specific RNA methylase IME4
VLFDVQYWDPPWEFQNEKTGGNFQSGASQKYPTLPLAAIQQIPVASVATPNAVLFLWVPTRLKFSHGATTAHAWGFPHYQTTVYWQKTRLGMGYWFRNVVEELLVFTKGDIAPFRCQVPNFLSLPAGEHSTKPEEFRKLIENATGQISRRHCLEGFARKSVPGWTGVGNAVTGRDVRGDLRLLARCDVAELATFNQFQKMGV